MRILKTKLQSVWSDTYGSEILGVKKSKYSIQKTDRDV